MPSNTRGWKSLTDNVLWTDQQLSLRRTQDQDMALSTVGNKVYDTENVLVNPEADGVRTFD